MADTIRLRVLPSLLPQEVEFRQNDVDLEYRYVGTDTWITLGQFGATLEIGTVSTLGPNDIATVENVGTPQHAILNIGIPAGSDGLVQTLVEGNGIAVDITDPNNPVVAIAAFVASRAALKELDTSKNTLAFLTEGGREGAFKWDGSDLSAKIAPASVTSTGVNSSTEVITKTSHGLMLGQAVFPTTTVNGLTANTLYFVIKVDNDTFKLASSRANAFSSSAVDLTGTTNFTLKTYADDLEGIYVIPTGKAIDGSQGAWVRNVADDTYNAAWFGTVGDNSTDDRNAIFGGLQARGTNGVFVIPAGTYKLAGTLELYDVAYSPDAGGLRIEAVGAVFSGGGRIIVNSCKRLTIVGLDAPSHALHLRGAWKCRFENLRIQSYIVGDVDGSGFSSCAWNEWVGGYTQAFIVHASMSSYCNHNTFIGVNVAGSAGQGFSGSTNYGIELNGNGNVQNLAFLACDLSYFNTAIYTIGGGNTTGDVELRFENCYFDDMWPNPAYGRNDVMVSIVNCHVAGKFIYPNQQRLRGQTKGAAFAKAGEYTMGWQSWAAENLVPNGGLSLTDLTLGYPISNKGGATLGLSSSGLYFRAQHASGTTMYASTVDLPFNANYCATVIMRIHSGASAQTITVGLDGKEFFSAAVGADWTEVQVAPNDELTSGSPVTLTIASAAAMDIDIAYIGVHLGTAGAPLMLPQSSAARAAAMSGVPTPPTAVAVTNVSATTLNHMTYTVEGKVVTVSFSVNITPTAAGSAQTQVGIPLPVPSNLSSSSQAHGVSASSSGDVGSISADATNDRLTLTFLAASTSNRAHYGTCQYELR